MDDYWVYEIIFPIQSRRNLGQRVRQGPGRQ